MVRVRLSDLQNKDIVNTIDGRNVGNIIDVKIDQLNGTILSLVVEPNKKMISFMNRGVEERHFLFLLEAFFSHSY